MKLFCTYHSNQLDVLKSLTTSLIKREKLSNPFANEVILVQSPGMAQWLKLELAQNIGISANVSYILPATFIWKLFTNLVTDVPEKSSFNKDILTWKILKLLPDFLDTKEFKSLKNYVKTTDNPLKNFQLAQKIADVFDQYLVYRPEWVLAWELGDFSIPSNLQADEKWQPILWQALYCYTKDLGDNTYHRANLNQVLLAQIKKLEPYCEQLPKRVFVLGISALPPSHLEILRELGRVIDVHFMFLNPCCEYWDDIVDPAHGAGEYSQVGNTLLASMGKLGRDTQRLLNQLDEPKIDSFVAIERTNLLTNIQADILELKDMPEVLAYKDSTHKKTLAKHDNSFQLHSCHSAMREIEVLQDNLLKILSENRDLKPRDIVVMVANIDEYSPLINAVFGNEAGNKYIPYSISDIKSCASAPLLKVLFNLLALPTQRCSAPEILDILEVPQVLEKFELTQSEFFKIKSWITQVGVRWGLDKSTATEFNLLAQEQNTWLFGLKRLLLGYAMPGEAGVFNEILGYDEVVGLTAEIAGKLADFIFCIQDILKLLKQPYSALAWQEIINNILDKMYICDDSDTLDLLNVQQALQELVDSTTQSLYQPNLELEIAISFLENKLLQEKVSQKFLAGKVNFCTLMPMRSVPFKVVCLLGMNDGAYPRQVIPVGFDMLQVQGRSKIGDRSRREDDRYLFLEAILAAGSYFYISYIGSSNIDNSNKAPSILVSELFEYCQASYCLIDDQSLVCAQSESNLKELILTKHPLTPYNRQNFLNGSFADKWLISTHNSAIYNLEFGEIAESQDLIENSLEFGELVKFWRLPVKYFMQQRLKINLPQLEELILDNEPFTVIGLDKYQLKDRIYSLIAEKSELKDSEIMQYLRAEGALPIAGIGYNIGMQLIGEMRELALCVAPLTLIKGQDLEFKLDLNIKGMPLLVQGWLTNLYNNSENDNLFFIVQKVSSIRAKDLICAWLEHLALSSLGQNKELATHIIGFGTKKIEKYRFKALTPAFAKEQLTLWVAHFIEGLDYPLAFFPESAMVLLQYFYNKKSKTYDFTNVNDYLEKLQLSEFELNDPYIYRIFSELTAVDKAKFWQLTEQLFYPLLQNLENY